MTLSWTGKIVYGSTIAKPMFGFAWRNPKTNNLGIWDETASVSWTGGETSSHDFTVPADTPNVDSHYDTAAALDAVSSLFLTCMVAPRHTVTCP